MIKKTILASVLFLTFGCNKFTALQEPITSMVTKTIVATEQVTNDTLPLGAGCLIEVINSPVDGGLMLNEQTGEYSYVFQDLNLKVKGQDQFSYRENCNGEFSYVKVVVIDTKSLSAIDAF